MKNVLSGVLCALILFLTLSFSACGDSQPENLSFQSMDTLMTLTIYGDAAVADKLKERISRLDSLLDATDESSEIYRLNQEKTAGDLSGDTVALLSDSLALCKEFEDSFDITVYPAVQAWGFTTGDYRVPTAEELKTLAKAVDYRQIRCKETVFSLSEQTQIDLGAVAKGYAADACGEILRSGAAQAAVLNLGGTVCLYGKKPDGSRFTVGVADPDNPAGYFGCLRCGEAVIATSGGYERFFEQDGKRYIHILDPQTAAPADTGILSVTIVADSGVFADAASTALYVMGLDRAKAYYRSHPDFDFIILTDDGDLYITEGIYKDFTLYESYPFSLHKISASY